MLQSERTPAVSRVGVLVEGWSAVGSGNPGIAGDGRVGLAEIDLVSSSCGVANGGGCEQRPPSPMETAASSGTAP